MAQYSQTTTITPSGQETFLNTMKTLQGVGQVASQLGGLGLDYAKIKQDEVNAQNDLKLRQDALKLEEQNVNRGKAAAFLEIGLKNDDYDTVVDSFVLYGMPMDRATTSATRAMNRLRKDEALKTTLFHALDGKIPDEKGGLRRLSEDEQREMLGMLSGKGDFPLDWFYKRYDKTVLYNSMKTGEQNFIRMNEKQKAKIDALPNMPQELKDFSKDALDLHGTELGLKISNEIEGNSYEMKYLNQLDRANAFTHYYQANGDMSLLSKGDMDTLGTVDKELLKKYKIEMRTEEEKIQTEDVKQEWYKKKTGQLGEEKELTIDKKLKAIDTLSQLSSDVKTLMESEDTKPMGQKLLKQIEAIEAELNGEEAMPSKDISAEDQAFIDEWNKRSPSQQEEIRKNDKYKSKIEELKL